MEDYSGIKLLMVLLFKNFIDQFEFIVTLIHIMIATFSNTRLKEFN